MARILVTSMPMAGHVTPTAAVAGELVRAGHEVVAYTGAKYRARFEAVGASWLPWTLAQDFDDAQLAATFPQVGDGKGIRAARANVEHVLFGTGPGQARDILAAAGVRPFDLFLADQLAFGAALAGEVTATPVATVAVTPLGVASRELPPTGTRLLPAKGRLGRVRDAALRGAIVLATRWFFDPMANRMRGAVGLAPVAGSGMDGFYSRHLVIAQGVPGLEYPRGDLPPYVHFVGRLTAAPTARPADHRPTWWPDVTAARAEGRPVVHVTQGTLDLDLDDLVRPTIAGLADEDVLVVVTTGGAPVADLGPLPGNVRAAAFIAHDELLPRVDVMITNGGWGGVLSAVAAGVPLVVAGNSLDKPEVARRVAWSGVGLDLRTGTPGPRRIRDAVRRVLDRPDLRERAVELGAALTAAGGAAAAAGLVDELLARLEADSQDR